MLLTRLLTNHANRKLARTTITVAPRRFLRLFTEKHEWISVTNDGSGGDAGGAKIGRVGISNHAQEALGDVVYVQTPDVGNKYKQFDEVGAIESVKAASELLTPVSGEITRVNEKLADKPGLVNSDCYQEGWLFEIKLDDSKELDNLMDEDKYNKFLEQSDASS
jgi:glycine cleavage system H protein